MHPTPDRSSSAGASRRAAVLARLDDAAVTAAVRTGVSPRAVVGLLLVALLVAGVLGVRVLLAHAAARPQPIAPAAVPTVRLVSGGGPTPSAPAASPAPVLVHVVGQVRRPGVVRLRPGSRVLDAVDAAGGPTRRADLAAVNLARTVVDGEQVVVPRPGASAPPAAGPPSSGSSGAGGVGLAGQPVDLNSASVSELDELPGIGPVLAGRIVQFRDQHGRYSSVEELSEVSGIGEALLERLRALVRV